MKFSTYGRPSRPCVLLLHTMFTTGALFQDMLPALEGRCFVVIPTLDGYDPGCPADYPGTEPVLDGIEDFLREQGVGCLATAAGSSLGAMLAWALWRRGSIPIRRLVLDSAPFGWDSAVAAENTVGFWQLAQAARSGHPAAAEVFNRYPACVRSMMLASCAGASYETIRRSCETCFGPQLPEALDTGDTELLLVYGSEDPNYQARRRELEGRRDLRLIVREGLGHSRFPMEQPLDFAALL